MSGERGELVFIAGESERLREREINEKRLILAEVSSIEPLEDRTPTLANIISVNIGSTKVSELSSNIKGNELSTLNYGLSGSTVY